MRYLGGKARIAKKLVLFLQSQRSGRQYYAEPFVGGGSVLRLMDGNRIASDISEDLVLFYKEMQNGWVPPDSLSEEEYQRLKTADPYGLRGFAGFFCSFAGKWFGGYARQTGRCFPQEQRRDAIRLSKQVTDVSFHCLSYSEFLGIVPKGSLVYCDPPYAGVTGFRSSFDSDYFWGAMREWSSVHDIFISEYSAPSDFECVWAIERKTELNTKNGGKSLRLERLFRYRGIAGDRLPSKN